MKKTKKIILTPKTSVGDIFKKISDDKTYILKAISEGKEEELKDKFKFVKSL